MTDYAHPDRLISTEVLASRLDDPTLAIVEVDEDTTAYEKDHIPGATALNWQRDLHASPRRDFVTAERLADLLGERGITADRSVVLYGGNNNWFAAYAYWLFRLRGVENVVLLNGGRKKWELESRPMHSDRPSPRPATYRIGRPRPGLRIHRDEVIARAGNGVLVDVRSPAEFSGELLAPAHLPQENPQVPGHIPGARNIPWSKAANDDGTFKTADELRALYEGADVTPGSEVVTYCRIGERSAHTWFVLTALLGYPDVRNYDGSWTEYGSLVDVPVELG